MAPGPEASPHGVVLVASKALVMHSLEDPAESIRCASIWIG